MSKHIKKDEGPSLFLLFQTECRGGISPDKTVESQTESEGEMLKAHMVFASLNVLHKQDSIL